MKKKLAAVCMSLTVMAGLCACGGGSGTGSTTAAATTAAENTAEETSAEAGETASEETAEAAEDEETTAEAEETAAEEAAEEEAGIEAGDKGDGPADIDASLVTFTVPEGYSYEAYNYYIDDADPLFGDLQFDIYKTDSSSTIALVQVVATTQYYVHSKDEAIQKVIELQNLDTYQDGKAVIGDDVTYGDTAYTRIDVTTEWSDQTFYVAYAENGNSGDVGLVVKFVVDNKMIDSEDPLINAVLDSLAIATK